MIHRAPVITGVLIFLACCIPTLPQTTDESQMVLFLARTHFDAGSGSSQTCMRVMDDGTFRLEQLPDAFSKTGDVYEGSLPQDIKTLIRDVVNSAVLKNLGSVNDTKRPIGFKDTGNLIRIVIPRESRQVIAYMQVTGKPILPSAVDQLLIALKEADRIKGKRLKKVKPTFCAPLDYKAVFPSH
jgi:hypothetical protein